MEYKKNDKMIKKRMPL